MSSYSTLSGHVIVPERPTPSAAAETTAPGVGHGSQAEEPEDSFTSSSSTPLSLQRIA